MKYDFVSTHTRLFGMNGLYKRDMMPTVEVWLTLTDDEKDSLAWSNERD